MFLRAPKTVDLKLISDNFFFSSSICFRSQEENACAPIRRLCWLAIEQTSCAIINWASFLMRSINYRILNVMRSAETEIRNTYGWSRSECCFVFFQAAAYTVLNKEWESIGFKQCCANPRTKRFDTRKHFRHHSVACCSPHTCFCLFGCSFFCIYLMSG